MDKNKDNPYASYDPRPPPYNTAVYGHSQYTGVNYQVGSGNIAVVSPPGPYENNFHQNVPPPLVPGSLPQAEAQPNYYTEEAVSMFSDGAIRRGFIRKVYFTLMVQLLVTVGIICAFIYWTDLKVWTMDHFWFTYGMMIATVVLVLVMAVCDNLRRRVPLNFIALGLFTVVEGMMLGSVTVLFEAEAVMWAVGATALVSLALTVFAMQSKWDFTAASGSLWVFLWTLLSFALLCAILRSKFLYIFYACLGTLLFSFYLVFDTQLILGGKHKKYQISPEEYIFAALNLYLDIVSMFLLLLNLIGLSR